MSTLANNSEVDLLGDQAISAPDGISHQRTVGKEEWLTPRYIIQALGEFDLDPCAPTADRRPWETAKSYYTIHDNGLIKSWHGRVWCNPPYGNETKKFLAKMAYHQNGVALVFARTDTAMFHEHVFGYASGILFIRGRLSFCDYQGKAGRFNSGAPSVLIAYGQENADLLRRCSIEGSFVGLNPSA
jgi:hypothetical protein